MTKKRDFLKTIWEMFIVVLLNPTKTLRQTPCEKLQSKKNNLNRL